MSIKGKGGLIPEPSEPLSSQNLVENDDNANRWQPIPIATAIGHIVPAQGAIVNPDGSIKLVAYSTDEPQRNFTQESSCN